jgi:hypothetical protein
MIARDEWDAAFKAAEAGRPRELAAKLRKERLPDYAHERLARLLLAGKWPKAPSAKVKELAAAVREAEALERAGYAPAYADNVVIKRHPDIRPSVFSNARRGVRGDVNRALELNLTDA